MAEAAAIKKVKKSSREQGKQISEMTTLLQQLLRKCLRYEIRKKN